MKQELRSRAYEKIKDRIIYFDLRPGDKIFESEFAKDLKISRTPVREALLMLENEGLVECHDRLGFIVKKLSIKDAREFLSIRRVIETYAIPLIMERISPDEIRSLAKNIEESRKCAREKDLQSIIRCETEFHKIIYKSTKSGPFFETISGVVDKLQWLRAIGLSAEGAVDDSIDEHQEMLKAIEKKDSKALEKMIQLHIEHASKNFELLKNVFL
jgi:GntR family transcriptional regulator, rspAB operon transcriptional repressor